MTVWADFTDAGEADEHEATIDWGDGPDPVTATVDDVEGRIRGSHTYTDNPTPESEPYTVEVCVDDRDTDGKVCKRLMVQVDNAKPVVDSLAVLAGWLGGHPDWTDLHRSRQRRHPHHGDRLG